MAIYIPDYPGANGSAPASKTGGIYYPSTSKGKTTWTQRKPGNASGSVAIYDRGGTTTTGGGPTNDTPAGPTPEQLAAQRVAAANAAARSASRRQNEATADLVKQQHKLLGGFANQRDTKLKNITKALQDADALLLKNYKLNLAGLEGTRTDNEASEADATFSNIVNAARERQDLSNEAALLGAGETDMLRAQLQALRNQDANQSEINRAFYDTQRSINNSITSLNTDVGTSRTNLYGSAEGEREAAWRNYYDQVADTWTQIMNIENSNTNIDSDTSEAYKKTYGNAGDKAAEANRGAYSRKSVSGLNTWEGQGTSSERDLVSTNRASAVNLAEAPKRAEGATLRRWG